MFSSFFKNHELEEYKKRLNEVTIELENLKANMKSIVDQEVLTLREHEKDLIYKSKMSQMGELISMLAHQWRQPLSAITTVASSMHLLIKIDKFDKDIFTKRLEDVGRYSKELSETIDGFRNFFQTSTRLENIHLSYIIQDVLHIVRPTLEAHNIKVETILVPDLIVNTYVNDMKQVLINIIQNSQDIFILRKIKEPKITIETKMIAKQKCIIIRDNGGGVDKNIVDTIFDPYFSTKYQKHGVGLGLYISKVIVEKNCNGSLDGYNDKDGTTFKICL